ncbi:MAG: sodium-dependent bicarbonate transport family permease [Acidimicrobiia bacterium]
MDPLDLLLTNLRTPIVLAFVLGVIAKLIRSDLEIPAPVSSTISIYLLLAIGLKGGKALAQTPMGEVVWPAVATVALGVITPLTAYALAKRRYSEADSAALGAHYGSVSVVTFIAAMAAAESAGVAPEGFMPALVAMLEVPAIIVALMVLNMRQKASGSWQEALAEVATGKSIVLLIGGLAIGWIAGPTGMEKVDPFFVSLFDGALTLFLLELGMVAAARARELRTGSLFLIGFGIGLPIAHGTLGTWFGTLSGMSIGGSAVLGAMTASASYIAAPAAVRLAVPEANPTVYLGAALGITFPFNLTLGIPLYIELARRLA